MVFGTILSGRQSSQKSQCLNGNLKLNFTQLVNDNIKILGRRLYFTEFEGCSLARRPSVDVSNFPYQQLHSLKLTAIGHACFTLRCSWSSQLMLPAVCGVGAEKLNPPTEGVLDVLLPPVAAPNVKPPALWPSWDVDPNKPPDVCCWFGWPNMFLFETKNYLAHVLFSHFRAHCPPSRKELSYRAS